VGTNPTQIKNVFAFFKNKTSLLKKIDGFCFRELALPLAPYIGINTTLAQPIKTKKIKKILL